MNKIAFIYYIYTYFRVYQLRKVDNIRHFLNHYVLISFKLLKVKWARGSHILSDVKYENNKKNLLKISIKSVNVYYYLNIVIKLIIIWSFLSYIPNFFKCFSATWLYYLIKFKFKNTCAQRILQVVYYDLFDRM